MEPDAGFEVFDRKVFVRRMRFAVRRGETEEQRVRPEKFAESLHDGNASAFAHQSRRTAEGLFKRA